MLALIDLLGILILFFVSLFLVVLFHELGHAIMALTFTKGIVNIYIGSHGETNNSAKIKTGRLITHIKSNPLKWIRGICVPSVMEMSINNKIIFVAAGPIISILTGLAALFVFNNINPGIIRLQLMFFGLFSVLTGITNFYPRVLSRRSISGQLTTTDGYKLFQLFRMKFLPPQFTVATELFNKKNYDESSKTLQTLIDTGNKNKHVLRLAINANLLAKNLTRSDEFMTIFLRKYVPNSNDYCNAGYIKSMFKDEEVALGLYKKSLALNSSSPVALNNIGHSLIELGRYLEAEQYLNAAISESPKFCHAHSNLGLVRIHMGNMEGGLEAIQNCFGIDPNFVHAYTCLGVYNMKMGRYSEAKKNFEKSNELGSDDLSNNEYLKEIETKLGNNTSI
jgi:Flp pilus assembly protein TadD